MFDIVIGLSAGFGIGSGVSFLVNSTLKRQKISQTRQEAQHIIQKAKDEKEQNHEQIVHKIEEYKHSLTQKQEQELENLSQTLSRTKMETEHLTRQMEEDMAVLKEQKRTTLNEVDTLLKINTAKEDELTKIKNQFTKKQTTLLQTLEEKFEIKPANLKAETQKAEVERTKSQILQKIKETEEHFKHNINQQAHYILELALNRFQHPYCSERGIKSVTFSSQKAMENLLGPDFAKMKLLETECGVDMKISDKEPSINILGIDPVRRELGRACLQRMAKRRQVKETEIKNIVKETKKELFRRIKIDGQRICRDLNLRDIKTEVKNMMGALRYRYSFAQNQHFHCQEVGWLCGLLNTEVGEPLHPARRAGMLHDIGKAMDHSKEGGHAVIGADFIEQHGETASVVKAVRAHHHDVPPDKPLDFLVIAADALSGARPGARRSTVDSYNQKVLTLEKIGNSFEGVKNTYIMSAGREIRVIVDSQKINDLKAVELSKKIARKIEEECSYPGLIKVTVVRTVTKSANVQKRRA